MCGIAGIFLKNPALEPRLGAMLSEMLVVLSDRGPDSAGFAIYGSGQKGEVKVTLRGATVRDLDIALKTLGTIFEQLRPERRDTHAVVTIAAEHEAALRAYIASDLPKLQVVGSGQRMEIYKEVGRPASVAARFALAGMSGTHAIGHQL
jgi:glutamate synthase domain-containing protein 1